MKKGYKFLMIHVGTTFCKFMKIVFTNHIFKIFYVYTKVPNSAKKFDHKILDWYPWNVYCQSNSLGAGRMLLSSSKANVGNELDISIIQWYIASLHIYHFSSVIDFS